jgi:hypothetical protein
MELGELERAGGSLSQRQTTSNKIPTPEPSPAKAFPGVVTKTRIIALQKERQGITDRTETDGHCLIPEVHAGT